MSLSQGQLAISQSDKRFRVAVCGRRWGKTYLSIREIAKSARIPDRRVFYVAPTYRMAKQIVWDNLKYKLVDLRWVSKVNESDLSIQLINDSKIFLRGADNYDSLRGVGLDFLVMDEFAMIDPKAWSEVLRPTLSDRNGSALFISTPMGKGNWAFDLFQKQHEDPANWQSWQYTSLSGGRIPFEEIEQARRDLDERTFRQEYEASFENYANRIYYAFERTFNVREPENLDVNTIYCGVDFNVDPMSCVVFVRQGFDLYAIDEIRLYSSNTQELVDELRTRYPKSKIWCYPDPAGNQRKTSAGGATDITILRNAGFTVKVPSSHTPVRDRINAVNSRLCNAKGERHLFISSKCKYTIEALERQTYIAGSSQPDKTSGYDHTNDALGYCVDYLFPVRRDVDPELLIPQRWGHRIG